MKFGSEVRQSAFAESGFRQTFDTLLEQIRTLYLEDQIPWVVGYSGGKDSTATLQLVWLAIRDLPPQQRSKRIFVITTDTLVENPVVASWVNHSLETMRLSAVAQALPIEPHRLTPEFTDTFWVNLIGRGYPAPRPRFRWCTERLKINPSNRFISEVVRENGEAIVVLGTRKAESYARSRVMERLEHKRLRDLLSPNTTLPNSLIYSPIAEWTNDDVWLFLMQVENPWGFDNKQLLTMYQGASPDGECPLVVDTTTPSCGDSRFGCWTCTLVEKDKSMSAMIQNDEDKEWMYPLLNLRNDLDLTDDRHLRDFRRMNGAVQLHNDRLVHGPYTQHAREQWLRRLLEAQQWIRENGPDYVRQLELITIAELHEIRRIWVVDKHELEDRLPTIFREVTGDEFPGSRIDDNLPFGAAEMEILKRICGDDELHYQLTRELIDVERRHRTLARRTGLFPALEKAFRRGYYADADDARERAQGRRDAATAVADVESVGSA